MKRAHHHLVAVVALGAFAAMPTLPHSATMANAGETTDEPRADYSLRGVSNDRASFGASKRSDGWILSVEMGTMQSGQSVNQRGMLLSIGETATDAARPEIRLSIPRADGWVLH